MEIHKEDRTEEAFEAKSLLHVQLSHMTVRKQRTNESNRRLESVKRKAEKKVCRKRRMRERP